MRQAEIPPVNLPILSEPARSTRKVCGRCDGKGKVHEDIPTAFARRNYTNGTARYYVTCGDCHGTGVYTAPVADGKMAASGGGL